MWNTPDSATGWNLDKHRPPKIRCEYDKNHKCSMSTLFHCDYRKDGNCTLRQHQEQPKENGT